LSPVVKTASGDNSSANPDKAGNQQLEAERNLSFEIGAEHFLPARVGTVGLSLFHRRIDNQVQKLIQFEAGRWVERPYNVGDALLRGGLFDFKLRADALGLPALTLRGNAAYTDTRLSNTVSGLGAGEGPRKSVNLGADYEIASLRLTLGGNYSTVSALDRESSATLRQTQGARRQLDLYALHKLDRQLSLRFSALNVTSSDRNDALHELDAGGNASRLENDHETTHPTFLLALEGKW
jgi:outer membrane receptor protein involved in Fe transport